MASSVSGRFSVVITGTRNTLPIVARSVLARQIRTAGPEDCAVKPCRVRRAQNRPNIAGILYAVKRHNALSGQRFRRFGDFCRTDDPLLAFLAVLTAWMTA